MPGSLEGVTVLVYSEILAWAVPAPHRFSGIQSLTGLSVSIVVYRSDPAMLSRCVASLDSAVGRWRVAQGDDTKVSLCLIDNGATGEATSDCWRMLQTQNLRWLSLSLRADHGNVGYGRGHNQALASVASDYHLILNPDVDIADDAFVEAIAFFDRHPEVVALSPRITGGDGQLQYLCRRFPSLADLFVRGFLPARWRRFFDRRLARYELRADIDALEYRRRLHDSDRLQPEKSDHVQDETDRFASFCPEIISGCFMLFRSSALRQLAGFDARYFLYFEDYDLSLRARDLGRLAYVPAVRITHYGGGAARKGWLHVRLFVSSAAKFFSRFGWRWL